MAAKKASGPLSSGALQSNVKHKKKKEGVLSKKKSSDATQSPRSFGVANLGRSKRSYQRSADKRQAKEVLPLLNRTSRTRPPPVVVVVAGPRGSGKSTLIRSLVKLYSRQGLKEILGPVTLVLGKDKRVTLVECPADDLNAMIDLGKVADVVLMTIDASFGFEMATFEFLSILQTHGFPKVSGVLTFLDTLGKSAKKTAKALKHRFWDDVYQGAKVFALTGGVLRSGKYTRNEMQRLGLFLQRQKMRPLQFRNAHSYVVCDRVDRGGGFCGWLRGARHDTARKVHVPGLGDFEARLTVLDDPLPSFEEVKRAGEALRRKKAQTLLYAPLCAVSDGGGQDDDDDNGEKPHQDYDDPLHPTFHSEGSTMLRELRSAAPGDPYENIGMKLFDDDDHERLPGALREGPAAAAAEDDDDDDDDDEDEDDAEEDDEHGGDVEDIGAAVYADEEEQVEEDDESESSDEEEPFFVRKGAGGDGRERAMADDADDVDVVCDVSGLSEALMEAARDRFVERGRYAGADDDDDDEAREGSFEILDDDEQQDDPPAQDDQEEERRVNALRKSAAALGQAEDEEAPTREEESSKGLEEKRRLEALAERDAAFLEGASPEVGGVENGAYVRFELSGVPEAFWKWFDPRKPLLVCGLLQDEEADDNVVLRARVRRHRWHPKILKARDPVVLSVGWRRFQTAPIFSMLDANETRHRFLKYTPEHMHCDATFRAPPVAPNSPIIGFHSLGIDDEAAASFRACLVGLVTEVAAASQVVKKLKLQGFPYRIERNTAFIDGMFGTALEAARFEGAKLKTVSGIRGALKKAIGGIDGARGGGRRREDATQNHHHHSSSSDRKGAFRATFEDKILMSDIVVCRLWVPVEPPEYCVPIASHLPHLKQQLMRTVAQVRRDEHIPMPVNLDSVYGANKIDRPAVRKFAPHVVPKALVDRLPFASKPKELAPKSSNAKGYLARRPTFPGAAAADDQKRDRAATRVLQALSTMRNERRAKRNEARAARSKQHAADLDKRRLAAEPKRKAAAKRAHAIKGQLQARKRAKFAPQASS